MGKQNKNQLSHLSDKVRIRNEQNCMKKGEQENERKNNFMNI